MIPDRFECLGLTIEVRQEPVPGDDHGDYSASEAVIRINPDQSEQLMGSTFWHEFVHCMLSMLGYEDLNSDEQFVEQLAQCLYQLEKTRVCDGQSD